MDIVLITGSSGLIGGECVDFFASKFERIIGIDNDMRSYFFGEESSTQWNQVRLRNLYDHFEPHNIDIRDYKKLERIFKKYGNDLKLVIHTAAQPSHDWAANEPVTDFGVNATGTLNLLELTRLYCPDAVFIFTSTNKVYGDTPNQLPLVEKNTRWEIDESHTYYKEGIDESMSIDKSTHSVFGASKVAADILTQEYGRYFGLKTGIFRGGCLTGPNHSGTQLHGFLSYLMMCTLSGKTYSVFGYKGKQVRDNIHSFDLVNMFWHFYQNPGKGEVYNAGGGRFANCSILEAIELCEKISGRKLNYHHVETHRMGDHIWYISDVSRFKKQYAGWNYQYGLESTLTEMHDKMVDRIRKLKY
ncbi:MAG TPA: NAD-dependent epimerase/dehydratase family protein [Saprospiraceae bacterium]|nr:NAD-dependent epimerase/dehydratase family protein [Saprospiraceae bacterium]